MKTGIQGMMLGLLLVFLSGCATTRHESPWAIEPAASPEQEMISDAVMLQSKNHRHSAEALYRAVLIRNSVDGQAANNLAYLLATTGGDIAEAEQFALRACTIEPANPRYLDTLGVVYITAGRPKDAIQPLEKAYARAGTLTRDEQRKIASRLVAVYQETGQGHLARQIIEAHRERDPEAEFND